MKKTLTIVMALALAVSMLASFAFVINPGQGGAITADKNPLVITGFFATSNDAIVAGPRVYAPLVDNTNAAYAKNEIIRFAITMDVLNPAVPSNGVNATLLAADPSTMTVSSSTVDFSVSTMAGQQALHVPFSTTFVNAINSKVTNNYDSDLTVGSTTIKTAHGATVSAKNVMTIKVKLGSGEPSESKFAEKADAATYTMLLNAPTGTVAKASYAFIFTGITKGEITEQGLAKLVVAATNGLKFDENPDNKLIKVEKNGRTYYVEKITDQDNVKHPTLSKLDSNPYYVLSKVGYRVYLLGTKTTSGTPAMDTYSLIPVAQLDSESVVWSTNIADEDLHGVEVEGLGYSLGLEKITSTGAALTAIPSGSKLPNTDVIADATTELVFRTVLSDGSVRYVNSTGASAFDDTGLARLNTMLADFGFSTADNYTYKLEDKYFTTAGAELEVLNATYNNGTVVPVEAEEEGDLEEGTPEEELTEEEGDIEEDIDDEEEVPAETGDFAADIALALTAAAIVAAAALAFVMKKARD